MAVAVAVLALVAPTGAQAEIVTGGAIAPTAVLVGRGYVARPTVLVACTAGQLVLFEVTLHQGGTTATGRGAGRCRGELASYPIVAVVEGSEPFVEGHADACAIAENINRQGEVEDTHAWCVAGGIVLV